MRQPAMQQDEVTLCCLQRHFRILVPRRIVQRLNDQFATAITVAVAQRVYMLAAQGVEAAVLEGRILQREP